MLIAPQQMCTGHHAAQQLHRYEQSIACILRTACDITGSPSRIPHLKA